MIAPTFLFTPFKGPFGPNLRDTALFMSDITILVFRIQQLLQNDYEWICLFRSQNGAFTGVIPILHCWGQHLLQKYYEWVTSFQALLFEGWYHIYLSLIIPTRNNRPIEQGYLFFFSSWILWKPTRIFMRNKDITWHGLIVCQKLHRFLPYMSWNYRFLLDKALIVFTTGGEHLDTFLASSYQNYALVIPSIIAMQKCKKCNLTLKWAHLFVGWILIGTIHTVWYGWQYE